MLQQTQVKTVLSRFYFPFLEKFPTVEALAASPEQEVLKAWEGLGYYTRARNLHKAAKKMVGKSFPSTRDSLLHLPGVGKNTAHAILAFGFHQPVPVMEANVKRILARVFALKNPSEKELWEKAESLLDKKNPFDYNQAMMDIGSLVCLPKNPLCGQCPLAAMCAGKKNPESFPQKKASKKVPVRKRRIVIFENGDGALYLSKREGKFLAGLYSFAEYEGGIAITLGGKTISERQLKKIGDVVHTYSHFRLEAEVFTTPAPKLSGRWHTLSEIEKLPLSKADEKALKLFKMAGMLA